MIRDEFKNADKEVIKKKSNPKIKQMGERAFYAKKLSLYSEIIKPINTATIFTLVSFSLVAIIYIWAAILEKKTNTRMIVFTSIEGVMVIWSLVWFTFLKRFFRNKAEYYKSELHRLNREYVMKKVR